MPANPIPVRRVPLLCGAPGNGGGVLRSYSIAMASQNARGRGAAGTRGAVTILPRGTSAQGIPLSATPAGGVNRQLGGFPYGASAYGNGFPFGILPSGGLEGLPMFAGTRRLGDATCDAARDKWFAQYGDAGASKYCAEGFKGSKGCDVNFASWCSHWGKSWGTPTTPVNDAEASTYQTAIQALTTFMSQLSAGQIDPASPAPSGSDTLGVNKNAANAAIYAKYADLVSGLANARLQGQMMWSLSHPTPSPSTSSGTTTVTPGVTPTPSGSYTDPATGTIYYPAGSQSAWGMQAGVEPSPLYQSDQGQGGDPIYGSGVETGSPTQYATAPGAKAKTAVPAPVAKKKPAAGGALALGALALIGLAVYGAKHRKKPAA